MLRDFNPTNENSNPNRFLLEGSGYLEQQPIVISFASSFMAVDTSKPVV